MRNRSLVGDLIEDHFKGITPKYSVSSNTIVLNQKCIRNNTIYWDLARFVDDNQQFSDKKYLKEGDILINSTGVGTAGRCTFLNMIPEGFKVVTDSHILVLRCKEKTLSKLLAYYLFSIEGILMSSMTGSSGQGELDKLVLFQIETLFPQNKNEQTQIAKVLSDLDAKIELNNKINAELEAMAKLIYDYWFVQFDFPYDFKQGKVADDTSNPKDVKPYKSSGGKMVYNEELKREIPEGWEVGSFGDYSKSKGGFAFKSKWWTDSGIPVVKIKDINENLSIDIQNLACVNNEYAESASKYKLKPGDVVIAMTGATIGKFGVIPRSDDTILVNQRVGFFELGSEPLNKLPFLINSLSQKYFRENIFLIASGAAQPNISNRQIDSIPLIKPPKLIINIYNQKLKYSYSRIVNNSYENQQLASLRDWLLPMLMNGQVTVGSVSREQEVYANEFEVGVAAEGGEEYEKKATLNIPENKKGFAKLVLAGKIIKECKDSQEFTNIKFQKLQHLAEHLMEANLKLNYYNQAAGPYDNRFMHTLHNKMRQQKWFNSQEYKYSMMEKVNQIDGYFNNYFGSKEKQFSKIISLLGKASENQCEIVSTLYAVWNDRIIKGEPIEDELLINDFLDWSERKKKYTAKQIQEAIQWMKDKDLEPKGFGELIKHAKKK